MEKIKVRIIEKIPTKLKNFLIIDINMKLLVGYLITNIIYLLIGSYIYFTGKIIDWFHYKEYSLGLKYLFVVNIIVFLVIIVRKKYKKNIVHIGIALATIFGIISTIFAYDRSIALEGCWGRYEGLYSCFYYLSLMLLSTFVSNKYKKVLVNTILICGAIQALYAVCQVFSLFNVKQYFYKTVCWDYDIKQIVPIEELWVIGFTNNPNFFGAYMLICLSYSFGLFIDSKKDYQNIIYALFSVLFMFGLLIGNSSSSAVGLLFVFAYISIYSLKNKKYLKLLAIFTIIIFTTCLAVKLDKTTLLKDLLKVGNEATEVAKGNLDDSYGSDRMYIWKETMKIVPNHIWHGVGIDSFHKAFNGEALILKMPGKNILYDKAHNEYLQTLVTQGIFALISYLALYGYISFYGIRNSFKYNEIYLVLPVIGYLVQAFFNISVIEVAPLFYIALGLCSGRKKDK